MTGFLRRALLGLDMGKNALVRSGLIALAWLTLLLVLAWHAALPLGLTPAEETLWHRVRAAQLDIADWRNQSGLAPDAGADPWRLGLIGKEWSPLTTTLGDLHAKRTACNPAWAIWLRRVFEDLGLKPGGRVAVYSSGSFPGLILNSLAAAESMELNVQLIVSLGASSWGANHMKLPWPVLEAELQRRGFIRGKAAYYTLGGGGELGQGMPPEAVACLTRAARDRGVSLLTAPGFETMLKQKLTLLREFRPGLVISIGGSRANLGDDPVVLKLPPGLLRPGSVSDPGNGVIGQALKQGLPVVHFLNLRKLAGQAGIPYDAEPAPRGPARAAHLWFALGLLAYGLVLWFHRRWQIKRP